MRRERVIHLVDARTDDSYRKLPPQVQRVFEVSGIRTLLVVPLQKDDAVLGFITAFRQEIRPFSDKQITLLQNFAAHALQAAKETAKTCVGSAMFFSRCSPRSTKSAAIAPRT